MKDKIATTCYVGALVTGGGLVMVDTMVGSHMASSHRPEIAVLFHSLAFAQIVGAVSTTWLYANIDDGGSSGPDDPNGHGGI